MEKIYSPNGLVFWNEKEIEMREHVVDVIKWNLQDFLIKINPAFNFIRCEASILTPNELISENYTDEDVFRVDDLTLRPETTMWSYEYAKVVLNNHYKPKTRLPVVIRQHWKSFRKEQDKTLSNMRLKEFYQLEFQIIFSKETDFDYYPLIVERVEKIIDWMLNWAYTIESDRLPSYSEITTDVCLKETDMEICSISKRNDFEWANVIEVAIGTDRVVHNIYSLLNR